jgi:hypothetical protein
LPSGRPDGSMAPVPHAIPVSVESQPFLPPPGDLIAEVFSVAATGAIVDHLDRTPVVDGVAVYRGPPLPAPGIFWAIRILDGSGAPLFRSGLMQRLPGPASRLRPRGTVSVFRDAGRTPLDHGDGLPYILEARLQDLPPPLEFAGVGIGSDREGRYLVTVQGWRSVGFRLLPFTYRRALRPESALDPGRPRPAVVARPEGAPLARGADVTDLAGALDASIAAAAEAQLTEVAFHGTRLGDTPFTATTVCVTSVDIDPPMPPSPWGSIYATVTFSAGAITGGLVSPDPFQA